MIERQLGNPEGAAAYLRRALATNPHFHPYHAAEARRALEALEGAEASGSPSPRPEHPDAS
jgi:Tfp pilus assembly protein PilF